MTPLDILDGIKALLQTKWPEPETTYYEDFSPQGFKRPSFLVEVGPVAPDEVGGGLVDVKMDAHIVGFLPVDAYHHSHIPSLCSLMTDVLALFGHGFFPVGDRRPHVMVTGNYGYDYAEVNLSISYTEQWEDGETYPLCESINIRIEEE